MKDRDPNYLVHEKPRCSVTVMSGLPAAGKDAWIQKHLPGQPVISLDAIRKDLKADATGNQGAVAGAARDQARILLREGRDFVWNATNLSRDLRSRIIDLSSAYDARVRIVYVESTRDALWRQNRRRNAPVPEAAILRLMDRWEVPTPVEADEVEWWVNGLRIQL
jgi:predicted kinase